MMRTVAVLVRVVPVTVMDFETLPPIGDWRPDHASPFWPVTVHAAHNKICVRAHIMDYCDASQVRLGPQLIPPPP